MPFGGVQVRLELPYRTRTETGGQVTMLARKLTKSLTTTEVSEFGATSQLPVSFACEHLWPFFQDPIRRS